MVLRRKKGGGEGKLTIKRHESLMRDQLLFMGGGGEDSGEDLIVFRGKGRRISRRRQSKKWDCSELTVNLLPTSNGGGGRGGRNRKNITGPYEGI